MDNEHPPDQLSGAQKAYLRGLAMNRKPDLHIGKKGLPEGLILEIEAALHRNELVKLKFLGPRLERERSIATIAERTQALMVGQTGRMGLIYRRNIEPEKQVIQFPV